MKKNFKLIMLICLCTLFTSGLSSCSLSLSKVEKQAKDYMRKNPEDYPQFDFKGLGLKYKSEKTDYNFITDRGHFNYASCYIYFDYSFDWDKNKGNLVVKDETDCYYDNGGFCFVDGHYQLCSFRIYLEEELNNLFNIIKTASDKYEQEN